MKHISNLFLFLCFLISLCYGSMILDFSKQALILWFEKLVPSLFVSMVIVRLLYKRKLFFYFPKRWITVLFHIDPPCVPLLLCMIFLGFPSGALLVDEAFQRKEIEESGAKRLIETCSFATVGFIVITCGILIYDSLYIGLFLFLVQLISVILLLFFTRSCPIHGSLSIDVLYPFRHDLQQSVMESGKALLMISGYLMLFMSFSAVFLSFANVPFLSIMMEFSLGSFQIAKLPLSLLHQLILISMLLSFGGLCVHLQIFSMCEHVSLSYPRYLFFRILQSFISALLMLLLFALF